MSVEEANIEKKKQSQSLAFVDYIIRRSKDNGVAAALRCADNPATEFKSWGVLADFGVPIDREDRRIPYATVAAAISRAKASGNGSRKIGLAIAGCYDDGNQSDQARMRLRRLLACDSTEEASKILRPLMKMMESRGVSGIDYASLLDDLLWFDNEPSRQRIKSRWAQQFYNKSISDAVDVLVGEKHV